MEPTASSPWSLLRRTLPLLERLGDFIGNGDIDPSRPGSLGTRCDVILDIKTYLRGEADATLYDQSARALRAAADRFVAEARRARAEARRAGADAQDGRPADLAFFKTAAASAYDREAQAATEQAAELVRLATALEALAEPAEKPQITVKCAYANGDSITTRFNGTLNEARAYFLGQSFNIGAVEDNVQKCVDVVEELT